MELSKRMAYPLVWWWSSIPSSAEMPESLLVYRRGNYAEQRTC